MHIENTKNKIILEIYDTDADKFRAFIVNIDSAKGIDEMIAALTHVKHCARHNAELFNNAHEIATNYQRQCIARAGRTEATK